MSVVEASQHLQQVMFAQLKSINIYLIEKDVARMLRALNKISFKADVWIQDEMPKQCAVKFAQNVYNAINTGKYSYPGIPYHDRYALWKYTYFPGRGFWKLKGDLAKNVRAFKGSSGKTWIAGIPNGIMDSGGKSWYGNGTGSRHRKEIAMYGAINEKMRPLFLPETLSFKRYEYKRFGSIALKNIGAGWR